MKQEYLVRIKDSLKDLRRNNLINKIETDLNQKLGLKKMSLDLPGY